MASGFGTLGIQGRQYVSGVAEFAAKLHEQERGLMQQRPLEFCDYPSKATKVYDIRAVVFDIYGTLVDYYRPEFSDEGAKERYLRSVFGKLIEYFGCADALRSIQAAEPPEKTLYDLYHGLLLFLHEKNLNKGITLPEVRVEEIWEIIIMMLKRHGYSIPGGFTVSSNREFGQFLAVYYNCYALGRRLYPGVADALLALKEKQIKLGIVSNGQFYTPMDLTLFLRDQTAQRIVDYRELFADEIEVFSYEQGVARPHELIFRKLYDILYGYEILPAQTVFVGNDLLLDIKPAQEAGMKTAFFTGDTKSFFTHDAAGEVIPDLCFSHWDTLAHSISFYEERK